jgi:hypothetical protein
VAAPLAAIALIAVVRLPELRLGTRDDAPARPEGASSRAKAPGVPAGAR